MDARQGFVHDAEPLLHAMDTIAVRDNLMRVRWTGHRPIVNA